MGKLFYKDTTFIGLDINTTDIKVMAIDEKKSTVIGYGAVDVDPKKMQNAMESDSDYIASSLHRLLTENVIGKLPSKQAIVSIPTTKTYSRSITIPKEDAKNLDEAIELEVGQYVPMPIDSLYVDHEILEKDSENLSILVSAAPKAVVDTYISACEAVGINVNVLEPSIGAVARLLKSTEDAHTPTLIVDIGPENTDIVALDGSIRVTSGLNIGGNRFTLDISKKLGISLEEAHQLKVLNGLNPGERQKEIAKSLNSDLKRIVTESRRTIRYYEERVNSNNKIEQLLIVGSGSNLPGIGEFFTNELVIAARVASPWQELAFGNLKPPEKQFRPRYITVAGLASLKFKEVW